MILTAAIAFVTLRSDPAATALATTTDADSASLFDDDASTTTASGQAQGGSEADGASGAAATEQATSGDESSVTQAQPASIPRPTVVAPVIVGIANGRITYIRDGAPAPGVIVELFASDEAGTLGDIVIATRTDDDGRYGFDVDAGCYVSVFSAPEGYVFPGVGETLNGPPVCVSEESPFSLGASLEAVTE